MAKANSESGPKRKDDDCDMVTSLQATDLSKNELCLHEAARMGNDVLLRKILRKNAANVHCRNNLDRTALHMAASQGHQKAVEILLENKASVDVPDKYGMTPMLWAAYFGHDVVVSYLLEKGANINKKNKQGCDLSHIAAEGDWINILQNVFRKYKHFKYDEGDNNGLTPFLTAINKNSFEAAKILSERNIDPNTTDKAKHTAWHLAAKAGHARMLNLLVEIPSSDDKLNDQDADMKTALYYACEGGHLETAKILLDISARTEIAAKNGMSALLIATQKNFQDIVELLLEHKADINSQNEQGNTALHLATLANSATLVTFLLDHDAERTILNKREQRPLHSGVEQNKCDSVEVLLLTCDDRSELFTIDKTGKTPLLMAARSSYIGMVDMIIKADRFLTKKHSLKDESKPQESERTNGDAFRPSDYHNVYNIHLEESRKIISDTENFTLKEFNQPYAEEFKLYLWKIAFNHLRFGEWKKLAHYWNFEPEHILAIEYQQVANRGYKYHGYRLLCAWFHGVECGDTPVRGLYEALVSIGRRKLADKIRRQLDDDDSANKQHCLLS